MRIDHTFFAHAIAACLFAALPIQLNAADSLGEAYATEYTFLKAQKAELEARLARENADRRRAEQQAEAELDALQARYYALTDEVAAEQQSLSDAREQLSDLADRGNTVDGVLQQMQSTLTPLFGENAVAEGSLASRLNRGFMLGGELAGRYASIVVEPGAFYQRDGQRIDGTVVHIGNVARYGVSDDHAGALAPSGNGTFRLWEQPGSESAARELAAGDIPDELPVFVYENSTTAVAPPRRKSLESTLHSGGVIGYIILGLGAAGLLFVMLRALLLLISGGTATRMVRRTRQALSDGGLADARKVVGRRRGAVARVLADVIESMRFSRERVDDVISESLIRESARLDRFGALILVIAAVAPLLGLLGTVSGMISTFDVITDHGTGDPKLLAGGISVALVTTLLGLSIAIPLLLLGNLLGGWAQRIKDAMERSALHLVNEYERARA